ncbi:Uncharacterised protein [Mycobacteroides abscessus subsp. abscessus]|nr:Uncharacterised protein [Mycobacteroides abscessus subsp. abscessus]
MATMRCVIRSSLNSLGTLTTSPTTRLLAGTLVSTIRSPVMILGSMDPETTTSGLM